MNSTMHRVDLAYIRQEREALFRDAHEHDVENGGHYDARSAAVNMWRHGWQHPATMEESDTIGMFYFRWGDTPALWEIETDEGFSLEDLMPELGRLEWQALGSMKHGDVPREGRTR
jgi:hypothetical protein